MVALLATSGKVKLLLQLPQCLNITWRRERKLTTPIGFKDPGSSGLWPCAVGGTTQHWAAFPWPALVLVVGHSGHLNVLAVARQVKIQCAGMGSVKVWLFFCPMWVPQELHKQHCPVTFTSLPGLRVPQLGSLVLQEMSRQCLAPCPLICLDLSWGCDFF